MGTEWGCFSNAWGWDHRWICGKKEIRECLPTILGYIMGINYSRMYVVITAYDP